MKDLFNNIYDSIVQNDLKAFNHSKSREKALCINIIEVPSTSVSLVTLSAMFNKRKCVTIQEHEYAKMLGRIEDILMNVSEKCGCREFPYFVPLRDNKTINRNWFSRLRCHKLFIVPTVHIFSVIQYLTTDDFVLFLSDKCNVSELAIYVDTSNHTLKITRYNKE